MDTGLLPVLVDPPYKALSPAMQADFVEEAWNATIEMSFVLAAGVAEADSVAL